MLSALNGKGEAPEEEDTEIFYEEKDSKNDEQELRNHVQHLIDIKEYREAFRTCNRYINDGRCTATARELLDKVVPMMKKSTKKNNRKELLWSFFLSIILFIILGLLGYFE